MRGRVRLEEQQLPPVVQGAARDARCFEGLRPCCPHPLVAKHPLALRGGEDHHVPGGDASRDGCLFERPSHRSGQVLPEGIGHQIDFGDRHRNLAPAQSSGAEPEAPGAAKRPGTLSADSQAIGPFRWRGVRSDRRCEPTRVGGRFSTRELGLRPRHWESPRPVGPGRRAMGPRRLGQTFARRAPRNTHHDRARTPQAARCLGSAPPARPALRVRAGAWPGLRGGRPRGHRRRLANPSRGKRGGSVGAAFDGRRIAQPARSRRDRS